jgi:2-hydroxychromene-2-carboxylate isomerase
MITDVVIAMRRGYGVTGFYDPRMQRVEFYWDPMCPFAWITSRWLARVETKVEMTIDWRFIALAILNEHRDYERDFPPGYPTLHGKGRRMLRVAAAVRAEEGPSAMGPLYSAFGTSIWERQAPAEGDRMAFIAEPDHLVSVLASVGLPARFATAADDDAFDVELRADTAHALSLVGKDVGTPIIAIDPPDGIAFFGPVISRVPDDDEAVELWNAVTTLARWPGFAELKRTLREMPQLPLLASRQ